MTDSIYPKLHINTAGQLVVTRDGDVVDLAEWGWESSDDGGSTWTPFQLVGGVFSSSMAQPGTLYRAQDASVGGKSFDPRLHEFSFSLTEEVSSFGIITWTLVQPERPGISEQIVTEIFSDAQDVVAWQSLTHSTQGSRYDEREVRDDGYVYAQSYLISEDFAYIPQSYTVEDGANQETWQTITTRFDEDLNQDVKLTVYDTGLERTEYRGEDGLAEVFLSDAADTASWDTATYLYFEGQRTSQIRDYDNGSRTETDYATDVSGASYTRATTRSDQSELGDAFIWQTIETDYDPSGNVARSVTTYDDGQVRVDSRENGILTERVTTDTADVKSWETATNNYRDGFRYEYIRLNDDGSATQNLYEVDEEGSSYRQTYIRTDGLTDGGVFNWETVETQYDQLGIKQNTEVTYDDGRVREDRFENGELSTRLYTDHEDQYSWYQISEVWEGGTRLSRDMIDDPAGDLIL